MHCVHTLLKLVQLRLAAHVTRMPNERLPKNILYGELQVGKHSQSTLKIQFIYKGGSRNYSLCQ